MLDLRACSLLEHLEGLGEWFFCKAFTMGFPPALSKGTHFLIISYHFVLLTKDLKGELTSKQDNILMSISPNKVLKKAAFI